jgi:hypothetical protein
MLEFKENVFGFVYDSSIGNVKKIYNKQLTEYEIELINEVLDEDDVLFTNIEDIREMFEITSKEDLEDDEEGFNEVFNFED